MLKYFIIILTAILFTTCSSYKPINNKLLKISNLDDFFCQDFNNNLNFLINSYLTHQKKVKSISIYRYSSVYQKYLLEDSIILNKSGKPIMSFKPYEITQYSRNYFLYDQNGNRYLDITIASNNYDTIYVLRKFDKFNRIRKEISYNVTRKEYGRIFITNITPISDSLLNIRYEFYDSYFKRENILPFETRDIKVKILNDSVVQTNTTRIVQFDTTSNSVYTDLYRIENNFLIPVSNESIINPKIDADCFEMKYNQCYTKRVFDFYKSNERELNYEFLINQSIVQTLYTMIDSLPTLAWENYKKNLEEYSERNKILGSGINIDSIELMEGFTIESFTPKLWYIVSQDSGHIDGIDNLCYVVGYNTPLKNEYDFNKRCLAIFENRNGKIVLRKQSFGALEDFNDYENDLLFDGFDETNFTVKIEDGKIVVNYSYMRGEATYIFSLTDGKWLLDYYASNHRTCCQAESYSYDYKTKQYSFSVFSTTGDEGSDGDTTINVIQERPIMFMDSLNVRKFDFNETGIIVK